MPNVEALNKFLIEENNFNKDTIERGIKKLVD